jgi:hypothetical protein
VIFVAGLNRSGTTLLDAVLGEPEGLFSAGEVHYLWRGLAEGWVCGCGEPLRACPMWSEVRRRAIGDAGLERWRELAHVQRTQVRSRPLKILSLARRLGESPPRSARSRALADYRDTLERIYRAIRLTSGAEVVVDSSKGPHDALVLASIDAVRSAIVHLVRDPRAVAYSWTVGPQNPALPGTRLRRAPPAVTASRWIAWNLAIARVAASKYGDRGLTVRYEDLCKAPTATLAQIYESAGVEGVRPAAQPDGSVRLSRGHAIAGDPVLSGRGPVRIVQSSRWREGFPRRSRLAVTAISAPLLPRYGYRLSTASAPEST